MMRTIRRQAVLRIAFASTALALFATTSPWWVSHVDLLQNIPFANSVRVAMAALICGAILYPIVVRLTKENETKTQEILLSHTAMIASLGCAIAKRDSDTSAHNYRVAWIAARIGEKLGLTDNCMKDLLLGSFLHDVGKIAISDAILRKPGKLSDEEFIVMQTHVHEGEDMIEGMNWLDGAHDVVSAHHEKWDGTGYPRGLKENNIPLAARIFAVADVFDALFSKRPYKDPLPYDAIMDILNTESGKHFDPEVINAFRPMSREIFDAVSSSSDDQVKGFLKQKMLRYVYV